MSSNLVEFCRAEIAGLKEARTYKVERVLEGPTGARVRVDGREVLMLTSNNYLGFANHPRIVEAARKALERWGNGLGSVRFICGTQQLHKDLEATISKFFGTEDTILYMSCWNANEGLFQPLLAEEDALLTDGLNHASIIDGVRLCKAKRYRYKNRDMDDLERRLKDSADARYRLIATDGVFSMDGYFAPLDEICDLAERYDALVMVDDSHAVGFVGPSGAGTPDLFGVRDRVDIISGTLGKALGGASGGYISARAEIVELLRQRARPYLFSNAVAPSVVAGSIVALDLVAGGAEQRTTLWRNARDFRDRMEAAGFDLLPGEHAIIPVMFPDAHDAVAIADALLVRGVYVIPFSYPVVPLNKARIRVQISAGHTAQDIETCVQAFVDAREAVRAATKVPVHV